MWSKAVFKRASLQVAHPSLSWFQKMIIFMLKSFSTFGISLFLCFSALDSNDLMNEDCMCKNELPLFLNFGGDL